MVALPCKDCERLRIEEEEALRNWVEARQRLDRHVASAVQAGTLTPASTQKYSRLQTEVGSTDENLESARRIRFDHTRSCDKSAAVRKGE
jgi:hypothetical protein